MAAILFLLLSILSSSVARNISPPRSTASLDVYASLQKTNLVLSPKSAPLLAEEIVTGGDRTAATLSLTLHARDFLPNSNSSMHTDYRTLTLARLRRDQDRADSIAARAELAVAGIRRSDLRPMEGSNEMLAVDSDGGALKSPVVSGSSQGSGEYFSRVSIGRPPKPLYMVLDTGSDVTWVQCQPCTDCYQQADPIYDPYASASYSPVSCDSEACRSLDVSACRNGTCLYQVSYGDGSYTVGDFATESVTFGGDQPSSSSSSSVPNIAFGCGHDNEGLFVAAAGLLGLGGGKLSFPSQIQAKSFSYCLVDRDSPSASTLDFGSGFQDSSMVTAPLLKNRKLDTFYYVSVTGISVGGEMLSIPPSTFAMDVGGSGGIIVDSGTAITRLQSEAYSSLRDAFVKGTGDLRKAEGVALFDTCYDLSQRSSVEVPTVSFHFPEGKELRLPAKNYLIPVDSTGTFCFAFAPTGSPLSIIGNVQQQGTRVAFDLENSAVGFTSNKC